MSNPMPMEAGQRDPNGKASNPESGKHIIWLGRLKKFIPAVTSTGKLLGKLFIPAAIAFTGWYLSDVQFKVTNMRQDADNADKERETKEQVLTDFGKTMQELFVTRNPLGVSENGFVVNDDVKRMARGHILIALRRLNVANDSDIESKKTQSVAGLLNTSWNPFKTEDQSKVEKDDESRVDSGKLKGLLIRYLYDNRLIGCFVKRNDGKIEPEMPILELWGSDLESIVLNNAWLPNIGLQAAELSKADFTNANLFRANLIEANLNGAKFIKTDLRNADLRNADLRNADLNNANLKGACYTEAKYFPDRFDPVKAGMKAMPQEKSDPSKPNDFEPCVTL